MIATRSKAFDGFPVWGVRRGDYGLWHNVLGWGSMKVASLQTYGECEAVVNMHPDVDMEIVRIKYQ